MSEDILDQPASLKALRVLNRDGLLSDDAFHRAGSLLRPPSTWLSWARLNLLLISVALVLSGVVFFFAYNWKEMGRFEKLALIQTALVACVIAACWKGLETMAGKLFLLSGSVLIGVFLAVFGQIYQTGADAYELFTGWAALMLAWVAVSRFAGLWFFWLVVVQTGFSLFFTQVAEKDWGWEMVDFVLILAGINALALVARETALRGGCHWLAGRWHRVLLFFAVIAWLTVPVVTFIIDVGDSEAVHVALWLVVVPAAYALYRRWIPDFTCMALAAGDMVLVLLVLIGRVLFSNADQENPVFAFLLFAVIICAASAGLSIWLARENKAMKLTRSKEAPAV